MTDWQKIKLGDISEVIGGGTPSTKNYDFWNGDIPWLTPKDLSGYNNRYISRGERNITKLGLQNSSARLLPKGSVLLTSRAPIGYVAIAKNDVCTNQGFKSLVLKKGYCSEFFYYLLKNNIEYIIGMGSGSTFAEISGTQVKNLEFTVPTLDIQKKIAEVLSALDDKIELNNKINNNLEQQFKLLYNYYFCIDSSELWNTVPFSKIISFQEGPGIRNWQYVTEKGIKFINIRCINNGDLDISTANMISIDEANNKYKHFLLDKGDIVMSCSGTLGRYAIVREEHLPLCLNTSVIRFKPVEQIEDFSYIYGYLTSPEFLNKQREMACGSVQSNFGPTHLKKIFIKEPPIQLRREFHKIAYPIIKMLLTNRTENTNLSTLRDTLLPKLMKGEIDVSKVNISADKLSFTEENK